MRREEDPFACFIDTTVRIAGDELVPTNTVDFSAYILNIRSDKPDMIYLNLAGVDQTNFLKQYSEYGLDIPLTGGVMDTGQFWGAGIDALSAPMPGRTFSNRVERVSRGSIRSDAVAV